ncbi:MAG: (2Fe-2S)-binding protein [Acidobacteria bacterium]|nr:MAG: (2Fe-2S)-binding protein [Acidobacteriota bacterium]REK02416.1 MAG: (2Fe-2S)-binding protein [Acidobacteriota bacterium]REK13783.1 MAG: (2Fe-2S)-binding protein [Acidobacteriota bacterium]REK41777.1 MAG: (2Fe-2S)-binding protein [Acidobacteriota bacterium]
MAEILRYKIDGTEHEASPGTTVAAALLNVGVTAFRISVSGEPRAPLCGMGICFDCRVTIDGVSNVRSCLEPVADGMEIETGG